MTDISISDIERISHKDLDKKIEKLSHYINRVHQRITAINNFSTPVSPAKLKLNNTSKTSTIGQTQ